MLNDHEWDVLLELEREFTGTSGLADQPPSHRPPHRHLGMVGTPVVLIAVMRAERC